jgi:hypothetical protein
MSQVIQRLPNFRFVSPIIVGFRGAGTTFNPDQVSIVESPGSPVEPGSLFEAQLQHRLGSLPEWIINARQAAKERALSPDRPK